jgi:hypothetical protein
MAQDQPVDTHVITENFGVYLSSTFQYPSAVEHREPTSRLQELVVRLDEERVLDSYRRTHRNESAEALPASESEALSASTVRSLSASPSLQRQYDESRASLERHVSAAVLSTSSLFILLSPPHPGIPTRPQESIGYFARDLSEHAQAISKLTPTVEYLKQRLQDPLSVPREAIQSNINILCYEMMDVMGVTMPSALGFRNIFQYGPVETLRTAAQWLLREWQGLYEDPSILVRPAGQTSPVGEGFLGNEALVGDP